MIRARSIEFIHSDITELGGRRDFSDRWEATLRLLVDGRVVFEELWNPAEFALAVGSWLETAQGQLSYESVDADLPVLWLRQVDGDWVLGTDLGDAPRSLAVMADPLPFVEAAKRHCQHMIETLPDLEDELTRLMSPP